MTGLVPIPRGARGEGIPVAAGARSCRLGARYGNFGSRFSCAADTPVLADDGRILRLAFYGLGRLVRSSLMSPAQSPEPAS